jgi:predicted nucleic acid-binding protein
LIVDTDVLIWYLRGKDSAAAFLDGLNNISISAVSYMELVQGMRNKNELKLFRRTLNRQRWAIRSISETICNRAMTYVEQHFLSDSLQMADALIAATCIEYGESLATANLKHYRPIRELVIEQYSP